nr:hypothetical protein [uncultured Pseudomonas sp.]
MRLTIPLLVLGMAVWLPGHASERPWLQVAANGNNPYNSPVQRANPNSRQGSVPATPPVRGPSTQPQPRAPTVENRGIGNGDNLRRQQQAPRLEPARPARDNPRAP